MNEQGTLDQQKMKQDTESLESIVSYQNATLIILGVPKVLSGLFSGGSEQLSLCLEVYLR
jgi:RNase H-fold protein (predicted Holliday junction resolvase)